MHRKSTATVRGLLTAAFVVLGMITVASVTVVLSNSQQFPTQPSGVTSDSTISVTSLTEENQTTTQGNASSPETTFVSILSGSADSYSISFRPIEVTVVIGVNNTVTWINDDNAAHTVTSKDGSFGSGNMPSGSGYTYTFTTPGSYRYYCAYHSWMTGTVVVEAA